MESILCKGFSTSIPKSLTPFRVEGSIIGFLISKIRCKNYKISEIRDKFFKKSESEHYL